VKTNHEHMEDYKLINGAKSLIGESTSTFLDEYSQSRVLQLAIRQLLIVERRLDSRYRGAAIELIESVKKPT
jgi:hypothetical protein